MKTLLEFKKDYNLVNSTPITNQELADLTHLSMGEVYTALIGGAISKQKTRLVLSAFNVLSEQKIRLEEIKVSKSS